MIIIKEQKVFEFRYINHIGKHCLIQKKTSHDFFCKTQFSAVFEAYVERSDPKDVQLPRPDGEKSGFSLSSKVQFKPTPSPSKHNSTHAGLGKLCSQYVL